MEAYPNMNSDDAKALVWGGLMGTNAYDSIRNNHPDQELEIRGINARYRNETRTDIGTRCK